MRQQKGQKKKMNKRQDRKGTKMMKREYGIWIEKMMKSE